MPLMPIVLRCSFLSLMTCKNVVKGVTIYIFMASVLVLVGLLFYFYCFVSFTILLIT